MADIDNMKLPHAMLPPLPPTADWRLALAFGVVMVLAGGIGAIYGSVATIASVLAFGAMLITAGLMHIVRIFRRDDERRGAWLEHLLMAAMYLAMGVYIVLAPQVATIGLTIALMAFFLAIAFLRFTMAWKRRGQKAEAVSQAIGGLSALALTGVIILGWPLSALWAIGVLVSVEMLMNGWMMIFAALRLKRRMKDEERNDAQGATA